MLPLSGSLYPESSVLIWHNIIFVFWIYRLVMWGHIYFFMCQMCPREVFEQICVMSLV